jgi:hypothetical protein
MVFHIPTLIVHLQLWVRVKTKIPRPSVKCMTNVERRGYSLIKKEIYHITKLAAFGFKHFCVKTTFTGYCGKS